MSCDPKELEELKAMINGEETPVDIESLEKSLSDLKEKEPKENKDYEARESRVYKGKFAPQGSVFLIVTVKRKQYKGGTKTYTSWQLVNCKDATIEDKQNFCFELYKHLKEKYKL